MPYSLTDWHLLSFYPMCGRAESAVVQVGRRVTSMTEFARVSAHFTSNTIHCSWILDIIKANKSRINLVLLVT
jgi:hypothetical protein